MRSASLGLLCAVTIWCGSAAEPASTPADGDFDAQTLGQLVRIRRVFVDRLSGGETAEQLRDLIISSLQQARLFVLTENKERADAYLRGSGEDIVFTDTFQTSDNLNVHGGVGISGSSSRAASSRRGGSVSLGAGENESSRIAERKHEAMAAVRLVSKNGDIIWSTSQESLGAKFRGASADVADKITRQLVEDLARARRLSIPDKQPSGETPDAVSGPKS
ncbi:MAG: hypothetical protein IT160_11520 [Bryobacterales bacterium]|nr:hypothetical protein [Bryobacterales bacterium]